MPILAISSHRLVRALRIVIPALLVMLIGLAAFSYWSRRDQQAVAPRAQILPQDLAVLTEGFTFSRTEGGRTLFSIKAKTNLGFTDNRYMLEDVEVIVNGATVDDPVQHVRSKTCSYDEAVNDIRFTGAVELQLDDRTWVRTEEMTYNHGNRLIASGQRTTLDQVGSLTGEANQFEYALGAGLLKLVGNVKVKTTSGASLDAGAATFHKAEGWAAVEGGVHLESAGSWLKGARGRALLEPESFKPRTIVIEESVTGESREDGGNDIVRLRASWLEAALSTSGALVRVRTRGEAELQKLAATGPQTLTGGEMDAMFDSSNRLSMLEARQNARMTFGPDRSLRASRIWSNGAGAVSTEEESVLQVGEALIEGKQFTIQQGEMVTFATRNRATIRSNNRRTSADQTEARFDSRNNQLIELEQSGNFQFNEGERKGRAASARFEDGGNVVALRGSSVVSDSEMHLEADQIRLNQSGNSFIATTNVKTLTKNGAEPVLVSAGRAQGDANRVVYTSGVRLWRENAYIQADRLEASKADNVLRADGNVQSTFDTVRTTAGKLRYDDRRRTAYYTENVRVQKQDLQIDTREMTIKLGENEVEEILARGDVVVVSHERQARGDEAIYDARNDRVILTGKNAQVFDKNQGLVEGSRLVMDAKGDRISVEGDQNRRAAAKLKR